MTEISSQNRQRNISCVVEYDGSNYHGWQCQPNDTTVQETLMRGVEKILDHSVTIYAAGRTDAGVHAMGQVINFHTEKTIDLKSLAKGINSVLPADIRIKSIREVEPSFHARYSAKSKAYVYCILNAPLSSPFNYRYVWHYPYFLDAAAMNRAVKMVVGPNDFTSFTKKNEPYKSREREILRAGVTRRGGYVYVFLEATGFLRYMVRNIVGTLVLVGSGKITVEEFLGVLQSRDRVNAGPTAPPQGLFLRRIRY